MKSPFALLAAAALLLSGCGQPGPLYMPKPLTGAAARTTPPPSPTAGPTNPAMGTESNANNTEATNQPIPALPQQQTPQQQPQSTLQQQ